MVASLDGAKILQSLGSEFDATTPGPAPWARFVHRATGLIFQALPGGSYRMGFSIEEERSALAISPILQANVEEMRPTRQFDIGPLLVSVTPVLNGHLDALGRQSAARASADMPAFLNREDARHVAGEMGCRLPLEREWEYLCRGGTTTLFPFGNTLPDDEELARWLSYDFGSLADLRANAFGLYGLFSAEWCADVFRTSLVDDAPVLDGSDVIRGGGAYFWPWQADEWVWCMSAMRSPASGLENGEACLRLVRDLPQ